MYCNCDALTAYKDRGGFTLDHVRPMVAGGAKHAPSNLVTACMDCNRLKADRPAAELSYDAARRVRNATRRAVPTNREGMMLFNSSRGVLGVARAALRRGLLDPVSVLFFTTLELPLDADEPDDFIPW